MAMENFERSLHDQRLRIAVVGGGISGLTAAHALGPDHEVTVFEAEGRLGGHSSTAVVDTPVGEQPIDTGFIVFNDRNYPNFSKLLDQIGADYVKSNMSFSVADETGSFEYSGSSPNGLFATRRNLASPAFHAMVRDLVRFNAAAKRLVAEGGDDDVSLMRFLENGGYSKYFIERLIVPQVSAVWSADPEQLYSFPARIVFEFFNNHGILDLRGRPQWRTIKGGSAAYVAKLRAATDAEFHTGLPVEAIRRGEHGVAIKLGDGAEVIFDEVVIATHSDQALALLVDATDRERELLGAIPYQSNDVVLHTDESLLPRRRAARASWNYHLLDEPRDRSTVTYWMNNLQPIAGETNYMVTLNLSDKIDPRAVVKQQNFSHPVFTREGLDAQRRHHEISGRNRSHFCGAYWRWGFHEDGAWSGLRVADEINARHRARVGRIEPDELVATP
jgi:predicted NAD/FAD-binding protein